MKSRIALMGLLASLLVAGVWYMTVFRAQSNELASVRHTQAVVQADLANQSRRVSDLTSAQKALADHAVRLRELTTAVPNDPQLASFLSKTRALADTSQVELSAISPAEPAKDTTRQSAPPVATPIKGVTATTKPASGATKTTTPVTPSSDVRSMAVSITVRGAYVNVMAFIHGLDTLDRLVVIDDVSLSPADGDPVNPNLSVAITARLFTSPLDMAGAA